MSILISIIIPAYNAEKTLVRALDSLLAQTDERWEAVIVNDGSTDDTLEIAIDYAQRDSRIRIIHQDNGGTASALNTGVQKSSGEFIARLDADDELSPTFIERSTKAIMDYPGFDIYASNIVYRTAGGTESLFNQGERFAAPMALALSDEIDHSQIAVTAPVRRSCFDAVGGFRPHIYNEDYDFWLRVLAIGARHLFIPEVLAVAHQREGQKTADVLKMRTSDIEILSDLFASGVLDSREAALAKTTIARHQKNLKLRRILYALMGPSRVERFIARRRNVA